MKTLRPKIPLDGFWRFALDPKGVGEAEGWYRGVPGGEAVYVPASWNEQNPEWDQYGGIAWYQRDFYAYPELAGKLAWAVFEGAGYRAKVWLNGEYIGGHEGSFTAFRLKAPVKPGENRLVVEIDNTLTKDAVPPGEGFNETYFDFFHYGGIHRPVYIEFTSDKYIEDLVIETSHLGDLSISVSASCQGECRIKAKLLDDGREAARFEVPVKGGRGQYRGRVEGVRPWSPEDPKLYELRVELYWGDALADAVYERVGFRTFEVKGRELYLNGRPIFLAGVNRHEDFPAFGRRLPGPALIRDFHLMKRLGVNAFRTSHYPYSEEHLDLADEMGFLVILEAPIVGVREEHFKDRAYLERAKAVLAEMIKQHRNRPSVVMYSIANEPESAAEGAREFLEELAQYAKSLDPTRPVLYTSHRHLADRALGVGDVIALNMYYGWYSYSGDIEAGVRAAAEVLREVRRRFPEKPILITEFGADAIYGLHHDPPVVWSEEYQAAFLRRYIEELSGEVAGMFIWNFADFRTPQGRRGPLRPIYNRKGIFTRDRQPKASAPAVAELYKRLSRRG
ncbi:MAG: glycoside hydrolase family 2 TIM barrel-domain containing protein [Thermoproteus sp. AZ2]|uniref:Glycoside hydrolase family 2 TIM barrel-domain containing protein n=1 Tax=Thermoproteus sp. AZ2 TaxID=1609232 RepID=A0ACC6V027_9CREN